MPTARETLLEAAHTAVGKQPWTGVRMVDVAAAAGVSRQTLYNEFGTKEGLGAALVQRLVEGFLDGAVRAAAEAAAEAVSEAEALAGAGTGRADPAASCAGAAAWMLRTAREEPIVRSALTGCWGALMPLPAVVVEGTRGTVHPGDPGELATVLCERIVAGMSPNGLSGKLSPACDAGLRIALSFVVAPSAGRRDEDVVRQVREVVRALLGQTQAQTELQNQDQTRAQPQELSLSQPR
jgi:AcrR family transcriptional regulator